MPAPQNTNVLKVDILKSMPFDGINNTILFENEGQRDAFFSGLIIWELGKDENGNNIEIKKQMINATYQREQWKMRFKSNYESINFDSNYMRYTNGHTGWIYCFITDIEWINPYDCEISFVVDSIMTYLFKINWQPSLISREHAIDTKISYEKENVSFPNYYETPLEITFNDTPNTTFLNSFGKTNDSKPWTTSLNKNISMLTVLELSEDFEGEIIGSGLNLNGIPSTNYFIIGRYSAIWAFIQHFFSNIFGDNYNKIKNLYSIPAPIFYTISSAGDYLELDGVLRFRRSSHAEVYYIEGFGDAKPKKLSATVTQLYTTYNYKTRNYPYLYLDLYSQKSKMTLYPEYLVSDYDESNFTINFELHWSIFNDNFSLIVNNYAKNKISEDTTYPMTQFCLTIDPMPSFNSYVDATAQWWRENWFSTLTNVGLATAGIISDLGGSGIGGSDIAMPQNTKGGARSNAGTNYGVFGGVASLLNEVNKCYVASKLPDYQTTVQKGSSLFSAQQPIVSLIKVALINDDFTQLDNYFDLFGYSENKIKLPNLITKVNGNKILKKYREHWQFLQIAIPNLLPYNTSTQSSDFEKVKYKDIPFKEFNTIKSILSNGICFWNYSSTILSDFGDYSLSNDVIGG